MRRKLRDRCKSPRSVSVTECNCLFDARTKDVDEVMAVLVGEMWIAEIIDEKQCLGASEPFVRRETCGAT